MNQPMKDQVRSLDLQLVSNLHLIGSYPNLPNPIYLPCLSTTTTYMWILYLQNFLIFPLFHYKIISIKHFHFIVFSCIHENAMEIIFQCLFSGKMKKKNLVHKTHQMQARLHKPPLTHHQIPKILKPIPQRPLRPQRIPKFHT